jgi:gliding motility-associated-like protein
MAFNGSPINFMRIQFMDRGANDQYTFQNLSSNLGDAIVIGIIVLPFFFTPFANAQAPFISSTSISSGKAQQSIDITGINFGTNASNIQVQFGGVFATPAKISDQFINVKVPVGASYDFIRVLNTSTGLSGSSDQSFMPSFGGQSPFDETANGLALPQADFPSGPAVAEGLYDVAVADFDGDGKLDAVTANNSANTMSVYRNTSTVGAYSFTRSTLNPAAKTLYIASGDLNGDGKPDVVATEASGTRVFVFQNTTAGAISFAMQTISLSAGTKTTQVKIADLDMDGKLDLIVSDQSQSRLWIIKNQSSVGAISLAVPVSFSLGGSAGMDGIAIGDLNGDFFPDIVTGEFNKATSSVFVVRNASAAGTINLIVQAPMVLANLTVKNFCIGDLNNDGKPDIAATIFLSSRIMVFGNTSVGSPITLADGVSFDTGLNPWGLDMGDVDGDGKVDICVGNIAQKSLTVFNNQSTSAFSFVAKQIATTFINRMVKLADMDLDGRPDFVFTGTDDNNAGIPSSKVSIIRNKNCVIPVVTPSGPLTVCNGLNQRLESSINAGASYEWFRAGVSQGAPSAVSFFDVTTSGSYFVQMVEGACSKASNAVQINVITAAPLGPASIPPVPPVCLDGTLNLAVSNVGATQYAWTGPGGFSANGLNVSRTNFQQAMAGEYRLDVITGTCIAETLSVIVDVVSIPNASVQFTGSDIVCGGDTKLISVFPTVTGFSYQWADQTTGNIPGAINASYTVNASGIYLAQLTSTLNPSCPAIETPAKKIRVAQIPVAAFSAPAANCTGQVVDFSDESVVDSDPQDPLVNYQWNFGDTGISTTQNPSHTFATAQTFNVSLTVSYRDNSCPATIQKPIAVSVAPSVQITNPSDLYAICTNDSLRLEVLGSFASFLWDTGETTSFIYVKEPRNYSVEVTAGCVITATRAVGELNGPTVTATATPSTVAIGEVTVLRASGLQEYHWKPNNSVEDSLSATTNAKPPGATTYTVYGKAANGCYGQATVDVGIIADDPLSLLTPTNYFSPNDDEFNPYWRVQNMELLNQCGVTIYDERGFKVHEAKPYLNDWDGFSLKGQRLPAGVYFYIIRCDDSKKVLSGSINLIR